MNQFDVSSKAQTAIRIYDEIYRRKTVDAFQLYPDEMVVRIARGRWKREGIFRILDAGCGEGRNSIMMATAGFAVTSLDTSPTALKWIEWVGQFAETQGLMTPICCHLGTITDLPFDDGFFDAVLCWRVLYYVTLPEVEKAMREFHRVLRPGGYLYVSVPNEEYNYAEADCELKKSLGDRGVFLHRYREDELGTLFKGFVDVEYGIQAQSFLGNPHNLQSFWHVLGRKPS